REAMRAVFPRGAALHDLRPWAGLRPATPTGLPVVGRHARGPRNLLLNAGHGALGFTLAFGTAAAVAGTLAD
ncbi:MAG: FAD-dependent oxidoreductase, partial [Burkholderiaceae bacterium]